MRREAWSAMFVIFGLVDMGFPMTLNSAPADGSSEARPGAATGASPALPSWPWRRTALLAAAAQLVTISALVGADPLPGTWSSPLLAVAPAPLGAAAAFAPAPVNLLAAFAGIAVLVAGIAGQVTHTGLFFVPALVVLAVGLLDLQEFRFEYGSLLGHPPRLEPGGTVLAGRDRWDAERAGLPAEEIEPRVFGNGQYHGRFMMRPMRGSRPSLQARLVAVTLAGQAGRALAAGHRPPAAGEGWAERCFALTG